MRPWQKKLAFQALEDRCRALEHNVEDLQRGHKGLALEWEELYDKVRHQMSRMSRRAKTEAKENGGDFIPEPVAEPESGTDPISERILQRRNRRLPPL